MLSTLNADIRHTVAGHVTAIARTREKHDRLVRTFLLLCAGDTIDTCKAVVAHNIKRMQALRRVLQLVESFDECFRPCSFEYTAYEELATLTPDADAQIAAVWPVKIAPAAIRHHYLATLYARKIYVAIASADEVWPNKDVLWITVPMKSDNFYMRIIMQEGHRTVVKLLPYNEQYLLVPTWAESHSTCLVVHFDDFLYDLRHERLEFDDRAFELDVHGDITFSVVTDRANKEDFLSHLRAENRALKAKFERAIKSS